MIANLFLSHMKWCPSISSEPSQDELMYDLLIVAHSLIHEKCSCDRDMGVLKGISTTWRSLGSLSAEDLKLKGSDEKNPVMECYCRKYSSPSRRQTLFFSFSRKNWRFCVGEILSTELSRKHIFVHIIHSLRVWGIIEDNGCSTRYNTHGILSRLWIMTKCSWFRWTPSLRMKSSKSTSNRNRVQISFEK